jgi:F-type H+-transporting ATPase subunit epsilon
MAAVTRLTIVTPTAKKFEGDAELVIAPGAAGDLGALAHHAPLLTTLRVGVVKANVAGDAG